MITIIIPIYKSEKEVRRCFESVERYTDFSKATLLLADDCSNDTKISLLLEEYEKKPYVKVLCQEQNLGFPGNVNAAVAHIQTDFIILNSDTYVTPQWLEKIEEAAKNYPSYGAFAPITNFRCHLSVPLLARDYELTETQIHECAMIAETHGRRTPVDTHALIGFCMFIRYDVWTKLQGFDVESFGRGYGEETDLCYRMKHSGERLGILEHVFIYHEGGVSFRSERKKLQKAHTKIIYTRYPEAEREFLDSIRHNPLTTIRKHYQKQLKVSYLRVQTTACFNRAYVFFRSIVLKTKGR